LNEGAAIVGPARNSGSSAHLLYWLSLQSVNKQRQPLCLLGDL